MTGALSGLLATASKTTSSGGSATFIIFLVLIAVVGYFLLIRPQKQKQRRQREQQQQIGVGDEVLTVGGIVGRVTAIDADRITIISGTDTLGFAALGNEPTRLVLVRNAIARKIEPVFTDAPDDSASGDGDDASDHADPGSSTAFDGHDNGHVDGHDNGHVGGHENGLDGTATEGAPSESEGTST